MVLFRGISAFLLGSGARLSADAYPNSSNRAQWCLSQFAQWCDSKHNCHELSCSYQGARSLPMFVHLFKRAAPQVSKVCRANSCCFRKCCFVVFLPLLCS